MNGLVLIDKPSGCTSHDVVNRWRRLANTRRVGHLGTLDPMATGLLAVVTGTATRLAQFFGADEKTYRAEITFGQISDTYDREGTVQHTGADLPGDAEILETLRSFEGPQWQVPPPVSAKKVNGTRAYQLARQQVAFELSPVAVHFKRLTVERLQRPHLSLTVTCSAGTYIRSLAHDLGRRLGCGGLLSDLRRERIGELDVSNAKTLDELASLAGEGRLAEAVIPPAALLPQIPSEYVDDRVELQIRQGRDFRTSPFVVSPGSPLCKAISRSGDLIAIGELRIPNVYHPGTVL